MVYIIIITLWLLNLPLGTSSQYCQICWFDPSVGFAFFCGPRLPLSVFGHRGAKYLWAWQEQGKFLATTGKSAPSMWVNNTIYISGGWCFPNNCPKKKPGNWEQPGDPHRGLLPGVKHINMSHVGPTPCAGSIIGCFLLICLYQSIVWN